MSNYGCQCVSYNNKNDSHFVNTFIFVIVNENNKPCLVVSAGFWNGTTGKSSSWEYLVVVSCTITFYAIVSMWLFSYFYNHLNKLLLCSKSYKVNFGHWSLNILNVRQIINDTHTTSTFDSVVDTIQDPLSLFFSLSFFTSIQKKMTSKSVKKCL